MDKRILLLAVIGVCLGALVYLSLTREPGTLPPPLPVSPNSVPELPPAPSSGNPGEGQVPDFTLSTLGGAKVTLSKLRGKVVLLNFWSSTCMPCLWEMPSFEKLNRDMAGKPFAILTVTTDPPKYAEKAVEQLDIKVPVLLDTEGKVTGLYGVYALPATFIIAPDGTLNNTMMGAANWADGSVIDYMNKLIESGAPKPQGT